MMVVFGTGWKRRLGVLSAAMPTLRTLKALERERLVVADPRLVEAAEAMAIAVTPEMLGLIDRADPADPMEWLSPRSIRARVLTTVGSVTALVCCATVFVTAGHALLPRIMLDTTEVSYLWYYAVGPMAGLFVVALVLLWLRHRSMLDLWLT